VSTLLRKFIRESLDDQGDLAGNKKESLDEGVLDWIRNLLVPRGHNVAAIHNAQEVVEEVYNSMSEFYEEHPRKVTKIRQRLESALDAMDELVMNIENPRRRNR
jgi:hypothetical protein